MKDIFLRAVLFLVVRSLEVAAYALAKIAVPDLRFSKHSGSWVVTSQKYANCRGEGEDKLLAIADFIRELTLG